MDSKSNTSTKSGSKSGVKNVKQATPKKKTIKNTSKCINISENE